MKSEHKPNKNQSKRNEILAKAEWSPNTGPTEAEQKPNKIWTKSEHKAAESNPSTG